VDGNKKKKENEKRGSEVKERRSDHGKRKEQWRRGPKLQSN